MQLAGLTKSVESEAKDSMERYTLKKGDQSKLGKNSLKMGQHENLRELKELQDKYGNTNLHCDYCSFVTLIEDSLSNHIKEQHRDM